MSTSCYRPTDDGLILAVRLTPRSGRDAVDGIGSLSDGQAVARVRVRAAPEKGAANAALTRLLAGLFSVPKSNVEIASGHAARLKQVRITGDPTRLAAVARALPSDDGA